MSAWLPFFLLLFLLIRAPSLLSVALLPLAVIGGCTTGYIGIRSERKHQRTKNVLLEPSGLAGLLILVTGNLIVQVVFQVTLAVGVLGKDREIWSKLGYVGITEGVTGAVWLATDILGTVFVLLLWIRSGKESGRIDAIQREQKEGEIGYERNQSGIWKILRSMVKAVKAIYIAMVSRDVQIILTLIVTVLTSISIFHFFLLIAFLALMLAYTFHLLSSKNASLLTFRFILCLVGSFLLSLHLVIVIIFQFSIDSAATFIIESGLFSPIWSSWNFLELISFVSEFLLLNGLLRTCQSLYHNLKKRKIFRARIFTYDGRNLFSFVFHHRILSLFVSLVAAYISADVLSFGHLIIVCFSILLPIDVFPLIAKYAIFYCNATILLQYFFLIDFPFFPLSVDLVPYGLQRYHYPLFILLLRFLPLPFYAAYIWDKKCLELDALNRNITKQSLLNGLMQDAHVFIDRAVCINPELVGSVQNIHGQTLLHIAALNGQEKNVKSLLHGAFDINAVDRFGNTPLHLGFASKNFDVIQILMHHGASVMVKNVEGKLYDQLKDVDVKFLKYGLYTVDTDNEKKISRSFTRDMSVSKVSTSINIALISPQGTDTGSFFYTFKTSLQLYWLLVYHAAYSNLELVSLVVLYFCGMVSADFVHIGYLVFFLIFCSLPSAVKPLWFSFVIYNVLVVCMEYGQSILSPVSTYTFPDSVGIIPVSPSMILLRYLPETVLLFVSAVQLFIFRRQSFFNNELSYKEIFFYLTGSNEASSSWIITFYQFAIMNGIVLCAASYFICSIIAPVSLFKLGYLILTLLIILIYLFSSTPNYFLKRLWFIFIIYVTIVLFAAYACQFTLLFNLAQNYYNSFDVLLSFADLGFQRKEQANLYLALLAPTIAYILTVFQLRNFLNSAAQVEERSLFLSHFMTPNILSILNFVQNQTSKVTLVAIFFVVIEANFISCLGLLYLIVAIVIALLDFRYLWTFPAGITVISVVAKFLYQLPGIGSSSDINARWIGFRVGPMFYIIYPDMILLLVCLLQSLMQRSNFSDIVDSGSVSLLSESFETSASVPLLISTRESETPNTAISNKVEWESKSIDSDYMSVVWSKVNIFFQFMFRGWELTYPWRRDFFRNYSFELTIFIIAGNAFVRVNSLSIFFILVVVGIYVFTRRFYFDKPFLWRMVCLFLASILIVQYIIVLGRPPFYFSDYSNITQLPIPWTSIDPSLDRFLVLGHFAAFKLYGDFFAFFFALLLMRYHNQRFQSSQQTSCCSPMEMIALPIVDNSRSFKQELDEVPSSRAVYDCVWLRIGFFLLLISDKLSFLTIIIIACLDPSLMSLGYVVFAMLLLLTGQTAGRDAEVSDNLKNPHSRASKVGKFRFRLLQYYNYFFMLILISYQVPFIPDSLGLDWNSIIGIKKLFTNHSDDFQNLQSFIGFYSVVIFILLDIQNKMGGYQSNLNDFFDDFSSSMLLNRGKLITMRVKWVREKALIEAESWKRSLKITLDNICSKIESLAIDPFIDHELWPTDKWMTDAETKLSLDMDNKTQELHHFASLPEVMDEKLEISDCGFLKSFCLEHIDPTFFVNIKTFDTEFDIQSGYNAWSAEQKKMENMSTFVLLIRLAVSNSQFICFALFFLNLIINPSFLSVIIPLIVLTYGIIERPRCRKGFWRFAIAYTQAVIAIKFLFQLSVFCITETETYSLNPDPFCIASIRTSFSPSALLGLVKASDWVSSPLFGGSKSFLGMVLFDLFCLVALAWNRLILIHYGIWSKTDADLGDGDTQLLWQAYLQKTRDHSTYATKFPKKLMEISPSNNMQFPESSSAKKFDLNGKAVLFSTSLDKTAEFNNSEVSSVSKAVDIRLTKDHTTVDSDNFVENGQEWGWKSIMRLYFPLELQEYFFSVLPHNFISKRIKPGKDLYVMYFVVELISIFVIFFGYNAMAASSEYSPNAFTTNSFSGDMVLLLFLQILIMVLDRVIYMNRSNTSKLVLHYFTVLYFHFQIFFVYPVSASVGFVQNPVLILFYLLKLFYFVVSAFQIHHGFPKLDRYQYFISRSFTDWGSVIYQWYIAIPFLNEIRILIDWMAVKTSLDLWQILRLEDIYWTLYQIRCNLLFYRSRKRGEMQPFWCGKILKGCLIFLAVMAIILLPLFLFSTANPGASNNNVTSTSVSLILQGPVGKNILFAASNSEVVPLSSQTFNYIINNRYVDGKTPRDTCQNITMQPFSDTKWEASPPATVALVNSLKSGSEFSFSFSYQFNRPGPSGFTTLSGSISQVLSASQLAELVNIFNGNGSSMELKGIFPHFIRLPPTGTPFVYSGGDVIYYLSLSSMNGSFWWSLETSTGTGVEFITISDLVLQVAILLQSYSIAAIYITVVVTVSAYLRSLLSNPVSNAMFTEFQNVDDMISFCDGIFIARRTGDLFREEELFRKLLKLYRSPNALVALTRRKTD